MRVFETREVLDLVFAWWGIDGREPQWDLPAEPPYQASWSGLEIRSLRFAGHPQETTENSVDWAYLRYVHGYGSVDRVAPASFDGHRLQSRFNFRSKRKIAKIAEFSLDVSARADIYGLGYSYVSLQERSIGMEMRLWILATPVDGTLIDLSIASQVREIRSPKRRLAELGFLPVKLRAPLMNKFIVAFQRNDVLQEVIIWSRKGYEPRPKLCRSDGEIMPFRAYCAQFYPESCDSTSPSSVTPDRAVN